MIGIKTAHLVGVDTWQIKGANTPFATLVGDAKEGGIPNYADPTDVPYGEIAGLEPAWLVSFSPDGYPLSGSTIYDSKRPVPDFWAERVVRACLRSRIDTDYLTWEAIVEITPETVSRLLGLDGTKCTTEVVGLLEAVFPPCTGEHVFFRELYPSYAFVLYIEPEAAFSKEYGSV